MKKRLLATLVLSLFLRAVTSEGSSETASDDALQKLAGDFWNWRAQFAPFSDDDVNRIERPGGRPIGLPLPSRNGALISELSRRAGKH